ncbi:MAG: hypothetical protein RLZZ385_2496 [Pseudomonadota bacterium]|jgi:hypothetical protein
MTFREFNMTTTTDNNRLQSRLALVSLVMVLTACSPASDSPTATVTPDTASFNTTLTMAELMAHVVDPAADGLWLHAGWISDAEGYRELYPQTDEEWMAAENAGATLIEVGNILALPGRAVDNDAWLVYAEGISAAGLEAMQAAEAKDKERFFQAGAELYNVCRACHQAYNPDILSRFVSDEPQP